MHERTLRLRLDDARFRVVVDVRPEERVVEEIIDGKPRGHTTAESRFEAVVRENSSRAVDANTEQRRRLYRAAELHAQSKRQMPKREMKAHGLR